MRILRRRLLLSKIVVGFWFETVEVAARRRALVALLLQFLDVVVGRSLSVRGRLAALGLHPVEVV